VSRDFEVGGNVEESTVSPVRG